MPIVPSLTPEQRSDALAKAAHARAVRGQVRADLKSGKLGLDELFTHAENDAIVAGLRVTSLLDAMPGYGKARAAELLSELEISPSRRLRGLGPKQRAALLDRFVG
ncbi:MAG TPA: integration host factor, actinobacterial type [Jatrophihabitans sp.]|jgi:hypothetical protein